MRVLAVRDRSEHEMRSRLAAGGASPATITAIVRRLRQRGYLDDQRLARSAAERAARRGYGSEYLRASLEQQGVADGVIAAALRAAYDDEAAVARQTLERRFGAEPCTPAERGRAARFLARRGFPEAVVFAILGEAC
ncbi:MAG: recombination regulator RecX [Deltaproteobacteria bacterium]|nr:recombination regulator RecX [Deltaproteobacteria bacterium]